MGAYGKHLTSDAGSQRNRKDARGKLFTLYKSRKKLCPNMVRMFGCGWSGRHLGHSFHLSLARLSAQDRANQAFFNAKLEMP